MEEQKKEEVKIVSQEEKEIRSARGKKSRAAGGRFELKVRTYLEKHQEWIFTKWLNNVDLEAKKMVKAKRKYNPFSRVMTIGTGFPDFVGFKLISDGIYEVIGIEVKKNGYLDREEKAKCFFYLENKIFSRIVIAKESEKRGEIDFVDFKEKYYNKTQ